MKAKFIEELLILVHWSQCAETGIDTDYEYWKKQFSKKKKEELFELNKDLYQINIKEINERNKNINR